MEAGREEARREELLGEARSMGEGFRRSLDAITSTAAQVTHTPVALVSLVAGEWQHFLSHFGWDIEGGRRQDSFCTHAICQSGLLEIPQALDDIRVSRSPLVTGPPYIRAYFGKTLTLDGVRIGTLCVIDHRSRWLSDEQRSSLTALAAGVEAVLASHRGVRQLKSAMDRVADFAIASGDWFWETNSEGRLTWATEGLAAAWNVEGDFHGGQPLLPGAQVRDELGERVVPPLVLKDLLQRREAFSRAVVGKAPPNGGGQPRFFMLSGVPRRDEHGGFAGFRGTARDVTARVLSAREARTASQALQRIAAEVPGLIYRFQIHTDGRTAMTYASDRIEALFELRADQVRHDASLLRGRIHPGDAARIRCSLQRSAATLSRWHATYRVTLPQRGERVHSAQAMPERQDDGSTAWYGIATDVTEEVREREQIEALRLERDTAARSANVKTELMSRVSHELRTPLNAIVGFAQLLRLRFPDTVVEPGRSARHIHHAGEHLLSLINDMLDISALEAGRFEMHPGVMAVGAVIDRAIEMVTPQAAQRQIKLTVRAPEPDLAAVADERATRQILLNLLANAIHFGPAGSTVRVEAKASHVAGQVDITVCDEGPGVSGVQRDRLFAPFERLGAGERYTGSGLGLSISRKLAQLMGGDLRLIDGVDGAGGVGGARFCLSLPASAESASDGPATDFQDFQGTDFQGLPDKPPETGGARTLLYIEDDPVNALVMEGFIGLVESVNLRVATTCAQGLEAAQSRPDLIFLDMHLPDGDGFSVVRALKADPATRHIPVIAVSADAMPEQIHEALRCGFDGYVTKPIEFNQLAKTLTSHLLPRPGSR